MIVYDSLCYALGYSHSNRFSSVRFGKEPFVENIAGDILLLELANVINYGGIPQQIATRATER